jgi:YD repeat-containing protein
VDWYDREGTLDHTWIYGYDEAGNVLDKKYSHALRPFSCRWRYRYDNSDRIIEKIFYDSEDRVFTMTETAYDGRGNKVSERSSGRGVAEGFRVIYEYDEAGRLLETIRYDLEGRQQSRRSSRYNGDLGETAGYNPDGSLISSTGYRYVYDEFDNWTERTTLSTNNAKETYDVITEVMSRTLSYFP